MTHKDRYLTAIKHEEPDMVPVDCLLDLKHVERIAGRPTRDERFFAGRSPSSTKEDMNDLMIENQKLINAAHRKLGVDSFFVMDYRVYPNGYRPKFIDSSTYVDHFAKVHRIRNDVNVTYWIDGVLKTPEDFDNFEFPDPKEFNYETVDLTVDEARDEYPVLAWCHLTEQFSYLAMGGIDKFVYAVYRKPEFAKKVVERIAEINTGIMEQFMKRGIDVLGLCDDVADTKGPLFAPWIFKEYFFPHIQKVAEMAHQRGVLVMKHSDGNLYPILEDLISLGIDGLHPIEPGAMDLSDVKKRYGHRIFLRGNVDCMNILPYGSEEDVRRDVRRCIDTAAKGGGFILAESNSMHANVKTDNIRVMVDEARKYGAYK